MCTLLFLIFLKKIAPLANAFFYRYANYNSNKNIWEDFKVAYFEVGTTNVGRGKS